MRTKFLLSCTLVVLLLCTFQLEVQAQIGNYRAGDGAGSSITTGRYNAFVGFRAGNQNTSGSNNTFVGGYAGELNISGNFNSFLGRGAGLVNLASFNTFIGGNAGRFNTTGSGNAFLGYRAGFRNISGNSNSFIGYQSGYSNTTGSLNSFLGWRAGYSNTDGRSNTFVGHGAGSGNKTGNFNSFLGYQSGYNNGIGNGSGSFNSFIGYQSGYSNTTGFDNSFFGYQAGFNNSEGRSNTFMGLAAGYSNTGSYNSFVGYQAGNKNTTGAGNSSLGFLAGPRLGTLSNATAIGIRAQVSQDNSLVLGAIFGVNGATANTNVGIRTTAPQHALHVNSNDAAKIGGGPWIVASDNRLKKDVEEFTDGAEMLAKIKPVWFRYNGKAGITSEERYVGVVAQDMQKIAPYTVGEFAYQNETGQQEKYLEFDGNALTYMLINAVKQQTQQITALQNELTQMKQLLLQQKPAIPSIKSSTGAELWQSEPNPLKQSTIIRYFVPETTKMAQLKFYSSDGKEVHAINISQKGMGEINLSSGQFSQGIYLYHLFVDGQSVSSKKLVVTK